MEKKGDILNQLAIISDLLEKANIQSEKISVTFTLNDDDYLKMYKTVSKLNKVRLETLFSTFVTVIGDVEFIFNKNNV